MKNKKNILSVFIIIIIILLVADPKRNINACLDGISLWSTAILPSLLPFFFLTSILASMGTIQKIGKLFSPITSKLFNTNGISGYVYIISIISGYPVGAKTTAELYENGVLSRGQACKITTFTSTSGPLFIIGTVGIGMLNSPKIGYLIFLSHILGAFFNGLLYRNTYNEINYPKISIMNNNMLEDSMFNSIKNILIVGGYVAIFYMIISMLNNYNILYPFYKFLSLITNTHLDTSKAILNGIIEMTRGCYDISKLGLSQKEALFISTGLISFGGASIILQALTFLNKFNISIRYFLLSKTTQTLLSIIFAIIMGYIFL